MAGLHSTSSDKEEIVEIRACATHCDSYKNSNSPQTEVTIAVAKLERNETDMVSTEGSTRSDNPTIKDKKIKHKGRPPPPPPGIKDDLTVIAHFSLTLYILIICYLCFAKPFTFFTWHPLLLSIGWGLLTTEAVLFISKENPVVRKLRLNHTWKIRYHWIILTLATVLVAVGFTIAFINKTALNKEHFKSWHGFCGLLSLIGGTPALLNGIGALYDVNLKAYIKPNVIKLIHQASGTIAFIFGGITLILSVYTNWFTKNSNGNKYVFLIAFITVLYSFLWTLQRPFLKCLRKMFKVPF